MSTEKVTGQRIIELHGKMSARPEYYVGYGNNLGDLNSQMLEEIHGIVRERVGAEAAKGLVDLVASLTKSGDVSASTFLSTFYRFADNGWRYTEAQVHEYTAAEACADAARKDQDPMAFILSAFLPKSTTPASAVSGEFLRNHGVTDPKAFEQRGSFRESFYGNCGEEFGGWSR